MLAWFGGIEVDLGEVELAPDAQLSLHTRSAGSGCRRRPRIGPTQPLTFTGNMAAGEGRLEQALSISGH